MKQGTVFPFAQSTGRQLSVRPEPFDFAQDRLRPTGPKSKGLVIIPVLPERSAAKSKGLPTTPVCPERSAAKSKGLATTPVRPEPFGFAQDRLRPEGPESKGNSLPPNPHPQLHDLPPSSSIPSLFSS